MPEPIDPFVPALPPNAIANLARFYLALPPADRVTLELNLANASWPELVAWARQAGVPYPDLLRSAHPYGAPGGKPWSEAKAAAQLRFILRTEAEHGNVSVGLAPPSLRQWWTYFGRAAAVGNDAQQPLRRPRTLAELMGILRDASRRGPGLRARVVGSAHAISSVAEPPDGAVFLDLSNLQAIPALIDEETIAAADEFHSTGSYDVLAADDASVEVFEAWQDDSASSLGRVFSRGAALPLHHVRVPAGLPLRQLNYILWVNGFSMLNLGTFTAQTLWGALSTGTHGSGVDFGPLSSVVRSVDMIVMRRDASGVMGPQIVRVEPTDGLTDPSAFRDERRGWQLIQDDRRFHAATVSFGSMGVAFAATIAVTERCTLEKRTERHDWEDMVEDLLSFVGEPDTYTKVLLNPYARQDGRHGAAVERIGDRAYVGEASHPSDPASVEPGLKDTKLVGPTATWALVRPPELSRGAFRDRVSLILDRLSDAEPFRSRSYQVLSGGLGYYLTGAECEVAVAMDDVPAAVARLFNLLDELANEGLFLPGLISLRFVRAADDLLSPESRWIWGRPTGLICMISLSAALNPRDPDALFRIFQRCLRGLCTAEFRGRPHWGLYNRGIPLRVADLRRMWGVEPVDGWLDAFCAFNPDGVFDNAFTERLGLSTCRRAPSEDQWLLPMLHAMMGRS